MKDAGRFGSAGPSLKVFTAEDAQDGWLSFRLLERSMREAGDGGGCGRRVARLRLSLQEVHDECSFGDFADGVGYSC